MEDPLIVDTHEIKVWCGHIATQLSPLSVVQDDDRRPVQVTRVVDADDRCVAGNVCKNLDVPDGKVLTAASPDRFIVFSFQR